MTTVDTTTGTAVVIGASITGALVARVLRTHFARVVLIEKDGVPESPAPRATVPQEHHVHLLLQRGRENMESLYPGFLAELEAAGAEIVDLSHGVKWHLAGRWKNRWPTGITAHYCSRTLVEHHLRRRALQLAGVELRQRTVAQEPLWDVDGRRVTGLRIRDSAGAVEELHADFVLDAGGRGSLTSSWLKARGYPQPENEHVVSRLGYASRLYRRNPTCAGKWNVLLVTPRLPGERRMGVVSPIEGDRWMVTAGGWLGDYPEATEESFLAFLRDLPVPDIHDAVAGAQPLSEVRRFSLSGGLRRRYDRLERFPEGYFVLGDGVCSFNPIYSQGMSVCSMQVVTFAAHLGDFLAGRLSAARLFGEVVASTNTSWEQARSGDERFPEVRGASVSRNRLRDAYFDQLLQASIDDRSVTLALLRANNLLTDAPSLTSPALVYRTLASAAMRGLGGRVS